MNTLYDQLHGTPKMLRWCLNVLEKIAVQHLHKLLKIHTSLRHRVRESIRRKRPNIWHNDNWHLLLDNAQAHRSQLVKEFLAKTRINVISYPPYSPDLTPFDFYQFPSMKKHLQGCLFQSSDDVKGASEEYLQDVAKSGFQLFF
ncbi:mariner Mos1 transposase [Trichonephila clavipes]|uniref:Mariner Mos1 transposase n=1 Tax=Trichonephila clavipes TaxID=2585209 RepID=A0A8X6RIT7_TRICX|nr:mariner Mos1 transposase [Trichonephila clavipes]